MRVLSSNPNVDMSNLVDYPDGRIKNNTGVGDGTPVDEKTKGDWHQAISHLMRLYNVIPNGTPDNVTNGFQIVEALIALASKNDFILPLTVSSGVLNVPIKLSLMLDNESVICKSSINLGVETQIKGSDNVVFAITVDGSFKANEYVRVVKTALGVTLVRLADDLSLNDMVTELLFLKKASQAQENAGVVDTVATTPLVNKVTYILRTIGADSVNYLATAIRNGLYPKEHFAIVAGIGASPVKNTGWFSGYNIGATGSLPVSGNVTVATATNSAGAAPDGSVTVTMQNAMSNNNYFVRIHVQGESSNLNTDNDICFPVFKPISTTQFQIAFREVSPESQSLKVHVEVVQL